MTEEVNRVPIANREKSESRCSASLLEMDDAGQESLGYRESS